MAGEIVGFYDGSTSKDGKRITLAGYAAKPEVWREVAERLKAAVCITATIVRPRKLTT